MKRRELYTGNKPFIFINFYSADTLMAEKLLSSLDAEGYRYWFNSKIAPGDNDMNEILERFNASAVTILIPSDGALEDSLVTGLTDLTVKAHKTLIIDLQIDTNKINDFVGEMLQSRTEVVIHREWENPITGSHRIRQILSETKGLSADLAEKYYNDGLEVLGDPSASNEKRMEAYNKLLYACENEYPSAEYLIGRFNVMNSQTGNGDLKKGVELMRKAAEKGNLDAIYFLGCMIADGDVFEKDPAAAMSFLSIAAVYNVPDAQYRVAEMLESGNGTAQDKLKSMMWYQKALDNGDRRAYYKLGLAHLKGDVITKEDKKAFEYLSEAFKDGNCEAAVVLAKMCRDGIGTEKNDKQAEEYFMKAADAGLREGQYNYALCLEKKKNVTEAFKWLRVASDGADGSDPIYKDVLFEIGNCYARGIGTEKNRATAFMYYYKAMNLGHDQARNEVANCYKKGLGVPVNKKAALHFDPRCADETE